MRDDVGVTTGQNPVLEAFAPRVLARVEGAVALAVGLIFYARLDESWLLFVVLFLVPDLSIPIYFMNKALGAAAYNAMHTYLWPAILAIYGVVDDHPLAVALALIWLAHIGLDRLLGLGLKYATDFKDTHLQRL
jgi:hypothetical protein